MIKIEKTGKIEGTLEMRGTVEELLAETVLIMRTLAQRLETQSGIPAEDHIAAMAYVANNDTFTEAYDRTIRNQTGVNVGTMIWKWGDE